MSQWGQSGSSSGDGVEGDPRGDRVGSNRDESRASVGMELESQWEWIRGPSGEWSGGPSTHLVPQGDLPRVPARHPRRQQPLCAAQEDHPVDTVVLTAGFLKDRSALADSPRPSPCPEKALSLAGTQPATPQRLSRLIPVKHQLCAGGVAAGMEVPMPCAK